MGSNDDTSQMEVCHWILGAVPGVLALSVYLLVKKFQSGGVEQINPRSPLGYPNWLIHFLRDDEERQE